jgi:hypothetical protein
MDDTSDEQQPQAPTREVMVAPDGTEGRVYVIPHPNLPTFHERLAKLVKRAHKIGVEAPTYTEVRQVPKVVKETTDDIDPETGRAMVVERVIMMHHLAIFHPNVVVSGWEFMAKLEHTEEGNILHTLPGKEIPLQYRNCDAWCEHCKMRRNRRDTFVLYHAVDDKWQQVGRNCLADFLGRDAERYADAAEMYYTVDQLGEASESYSEGGGGGGPRYEMLDRYLTYVAEVIAHVGWRSRSTAYNYGGAATADIALRHLWRRKYDPKMDLFREPTDKSAEEAKAAIQWAEDITDEEVLHSEYLHNIRVIARRGVVGDKQFGYAASIVSGYKRHLGELELKARGERKESQWVGQEGDRRIFDLLVEKVIQLDSNFGPSSQLHIMSDEDDNRFIWFAHGTSLDQGRKVLLKGTIKKHTERQGVKQTMLTRCEVMVLKNYTAAYQGDDYHFRATDPKDARRVLLGMMSLDRMPRGLKIVEEGTTTTTTPTSYEAPSAVVSDMDDMMLPVDMD